MKNIYTLVDEKKGAAKSAMLKDVRYNLGLDAAAL